MLTVNADDHAFMRRFHAPGHEKRMVVILNPQDFDGWLRCEVAEARAMYCRPSLQMLDGVPAPLPARPKGVNAARARAPLHKPSSDGMGTTGDLF
jgi:putative SOS response-associated peptidase YedK